MRFPFRRFTGNRRGNFTIMSALVAVPMVMAVGITLDLSTIARTRTKLQQAIDSSVLAVAHEGKAISDRQAKEIAEKFLAGNFDPTVTQLSVVHKGTSFSVEAQTNAGIRLEEPNVATGTMLKECASTPDNYFDVPSRRQLDDAFNRSRKDSSRCALPPKRRGRAACADHD